MRSIKLWMIPACIMISIPAGCSDNKGESVNTRTGSGVLVSGYAPERSDWKAFLSCWQKEIADEVIGENADSEWEKKAIENRGQVLPPASDQEIKAAESRLGKVLPRSYIDFLYASNGWIQLGLGPDDTKILSVSEIGLLNEKDPQLIDDWMRFSSDRKIPDSKYYLYGMKQDSAVFRDQYLQSALMISRPTGDNVYLLNPKVVTKDGEYEAWFFSFDIGAIRFKSFASLMRNLYYMSSQRSEAMMPYPEEELKGTCADYIVVNPPE